MRRAAIATKRHHGPGWIDVPIAEFVSIRTSTVRWLLLGLATLVAGCCTHRRHYPPPTPARLTQQLRGVGQPPPTLRAKAKVDQWTRKGRIKLRVFMLATARGQLRFEAVSPFDTPLVTLTSDGTRFASIDHKHDVFYRGPAKACNIARVFGLALPPREVSRTLTGGTPVIPHERATLRWDRCEGAEVLTLVGSEGRTQRIWLRKRGGKWQVLRSEVRDGDKKVVFELRFDNFRRIQGRWIPWEIKVEQPQRKADLIIRYQKLELGVKIPDAAYQLRVPAGLPVRVLDCP